MGLAQPKRRYTVEEYFRLERESLEKHEFHDGLIVPAGQVAAMAGGTYEHSLICANVLRELGNALKGKPCRVLESNLRVLLPKPPLYVYPDATVICGPPQFDPQDPDRGSVTNPRLIVEVLSPSPESYDRGEKFRRYLELGSLNECVLISQHEPRVETYLRQQGGGWLFNPVTSVDAAVQLRSLDVTLRLSDVYDGVDFCPPSVGGAG